MTVTVSKHAELSSPSDQTPHQNDVSIVNFPLGPTSFDHSRPLTPIAHDGAHLNLFGEGVLVDLDM